MNKIIISLGGSLIVPDNIDTKFLKEFKELILEHVKKGKKFFIICGGGRICRKYFSFFIREFYGGRIALLE